MKNTQHDTLSQIKMYKSKVMIEETQLQNFVRYLDQAVFKKMFFFCSPHRASIAPSFQRSFNTLSDYEKADYYLACLKIIYEFIKVKKFVQQKNRENQKVEMQYRKENDSKLWKRTFIIISFDQLTIEVEALKVKLRMENYIIRRSKSSHKHAFVLQSTRPDCEPTTLRLAHANATQLQQLLTKMGGLVMGGLRRKLSRMMGMSRESRQFTQDWLQKQQCMSVTIAKSIPQQHKSLREMLKTKISVDIDLSMKPGNDQIPKQLIDEDILKGMESFRYYEEVEKGLFIHQNKQRTRKICLYSSKSITVQTIAGQLFNHDRFKEWNNSLYSISLIGDVAKQNTKFYHSINLYTDNNEVDYVFMRHRFEREGMLYFIDKSIATAEYGSHQNTNSRGKIQYCLWRIKQKEDCIELVVEIQITHIPCIDVYRAMGQQIGELENMVAAKKEAVKMKKKLSLSDVSFFSMDQGSFSVSMDVLNQLESYQRVEDPKPISEEEEQEHSFYSIMDNENEKKQEQLQNWSVNATAKTKEEDKIIPAYRYQTNPYQSPQKVYKNMKAGMFFNPEQCVPNEIGDLVFTNQQKIKAQSSIIKSVLKRIGSNVLTGRSILNISLPIQIFASDTNLQRLCRGMAYAPLFLQKKQLASPLERMKAAICFAVGNLILYIQMAKPFNPILGETYQGFIDGCPIYGEQVSHHPPISSLYMVGRGYKVSGNIEAKVQLGLNSISGLNDGLYHVSFGNNCPANSGITFSCPPGELSGVIYGERKLNITKKSRFFDAQNKLFCQITWGKNKSKDTVGRYHDYLQGKIVQLNKNNSNIGKIKQSDKDIVLGHITGRWTEVLYFNGQPIFQINQLKPYQATEQPRPLLSDSKFRQDRQLVEQGNFAQAQIAKQKWQQCQRRDRKLRKQKNG